MSPIQLRSMTRTFMIAWNMVMVSLTVILMTTSVSAIDIAEVRAAIEKRVQSFATVDVKWKTTTHFTEAHSRRLRAVPFGGEAQQPSDRFPATLEWDAQLQCEDTRLRLDYARPTWNFNSARFEMIPHVLVFDGNVGRLLSTTESTRFPHQGIMTDDAMHARGDNDFSPVTWHYRAFAYPGMLGEPLFGPDAEISEEELNRQSFVVLKTYLRPSREVSYTRILWIDAALNYAVYRYAQLRNGKIKYDLHCVASRSDGGEVLLNSWKLEEYNDEGQLLIAKSAHVVSTHVNQPMEPSRFILHFPEGTSVSDQRSSHADGPVAMEYSREREILIGAGQREFEVSGRQRGEALSARALLVELERSQQEYRLPRIVVGGLLIGLIVILGSLFMWHHKTRNIKKIC